MSANPENAPIHPTVGGCLGGVAWGLLVFWIASYWTSGQTLWIIAGGVGSVMGILICLSNLHAQSINRANRAKNEARIAKQMRAVAAAPRPAPEPLPELSAADMQLVEELVRAYPGYLPRREGVVRDVGRKLNERGGMKLMLRAHAEIAERLGATAARELEVAWDSIGEWQG